MSFWRRRADYRCVLIYRDEGVLRLYSVDMDMLTFSKASLSLFIAIIHADLEESIEPESEFINHEVFCLTERHSMAKDPARLRTVNATGKYNVCVTAAS